MHPRSLGPWGASRFSGFAHAADPIIEYQRLRGWGTECAVFPTKQGNCFVSFVCVCVRVAYPMSVRFATELIVRKYV